MTLRLRTSLRMGRGQAGGILRVRGGDFLLVERADWPAAIHLRSDRDGELRHSSHVPVGDRPYHVVWTPRGSHTRIISLRRANGRETARYEQEKA